MARKRAPSPLRVALIGTKFMGRAHASAWGQVGRFFELERPVSVELVAARDAVSGVNLDEVTTYSGVYRPFRQMRLASIHPIVEGYKDSLAVGVRMNVSDPLGLHSIDATAAGYKPTRFK